MKRYTDLLKPVPVSYSGTGYSDFEFPAAVFPSAVHNDVVFCGKVITRRTEPDPEPETRNQSEEKRLLRSESSSRSNRFNAWLRSPSGREIRCRRSESSRKRCNGIFGPVKFPLQMELSDIKMRQERREPLPIPKFAAKYNGDSGESYWELVRPLRRRGMLMNALAKASFGCIPIV